MKALLGMPLAAAARLRRAAYDHGLFRVERLRGPVVSVGNLAIGGRGKTPVVARVCELLREDGHAVAVLSRGYRGSFRGDCLVVSDGQRVAATAEAAGDEPVMLARSLPGVVVAVGRRRARAGRVVEERFGPRVHVLDDGFQHLPLYRDLDLVCVATRDLGDVPMPGGRLREPVSALRRADLVLLSGAENTAARTRGPAELPVGADRVLVLRRKVLGFVSRPGTVATAPRRPYLLAAIAEPERLHVDMKSLVSDVAGTSFFGDHHAFSAADLRAVGERARAAGADAIVTTAKDEVRLPAEVDLGLPLLVLRIAADIENEGLLRDRLRAAAGKAS